MVNCSIDRTGASVGGHLRVSGSYCHAFALNFGEFAGFWLDIWRIWILTLLLASVLHELKRSFDLSFLRSWQRQRGWCSMVRKGWRLNKQTPPKIVYHSSNEDCCVLRIHPHKCHNFAFRWHMRSEQIFVFVGARYKHIRIQKPYITVHLVSRHRNSKPETPNSTGQPAKNGHLEVTGRA